MEKKLSDYLHFYLGAECYWNAYPMHSFKLESVSVGVQSQSAKLIPIIENEGEQYPNESWVQVRDNIKPILRPLSSMTEEEAKAVYTIEKDRVLHETILDFDLSERDHGFVIHRLDDLNVSMMMGFDGVCYKVVQDGSRKTIEPALNQPLIFAYLLSKHFDLFGLIESGLAIDSQSTNQ